MLLSLPKGFCAAQLKAGPAVWAPAFHAVLTGPEFLLLGCSVPRDMSPTMVQGHKQLQCDPVQIGAIVTAIFGGIHTYEDVKEQGHLPGFSPFCQD